jgi:hypothetical protein
MADLLERIMARYPRVGQRCFELEAISLAKKAVGLKEGDSLLKSEDDILPALAQAVHESDVDLADMARDCGFEPIELRRKLALGRVGELLEPGEISGLSDEELASRLQRAADEYSLETRELLDEILCPSATIARASAAPRVRRRRAKVLWLLRCRMCHLLWPRPYRIDFTPYLCGEYRFPRESEYACYRCLPTYLSDQQVNGIMRCPDSEILKPPYVRAWFAPLAFVAIAILVVSSLHLHSRGATREAAEIPPPHAIAAPAHLGTKIVPRSDGELVRSEAGQSNPAVTAPVPAPLASASTAVAPSPKAAGSQASGILTGKQREIVPPSASKLVRSEAGRSNPPVTVPVPTSVASTSTAVAPSPTAAGSQTSGILTGKQRQIAALSVVGLPGATRSEKSYRQRGDQSGRQVSDRAIVLNNCRQILRNERPLMRYSIRDIVQDADREALPVANVCVRTITNLAENGKECADLFDWFEVFQTRLTKHVNRVCSEALSKSKTIHTNTEPVLAK